MTENIVSAYYPNNQVERKTNIGKTTNKKQKQAREKLRGQPFPDRWPWAIINRELKVKGLQKLKS